MCGIYQNTFDHLIDDYLQKELYLENFEKKNEKLIDDIKADKHYDKKNMEKKKKYSTNKESKKKKKNNIANNYIWNISKRITALKDMENVYDSNNSAKYNDNEKNYINNKMKNKNKKK